MARKLNRNRPVGHITPPHNGAYFEQDGVWFDQAGAEIGPAPGSKPSREPATPLPHPQPAQSSDVDETGFLDSDRPLIDLREPWFSVQSKIQALVGRKPKNKDEARALLEAEDIRFSG